MSDKQGYVTLSSSKNSETLSEASLLARSIKINDPDREVCLVTDSYDDLPSHIEKNFDYVVELPYGAIIEEDFEVNMWQIYYCTPFDQNIWLRKQCLLLNNIDGLWDNIKDEDILFPYKTTNFKNEYKEFLYYFKCHEKNNFNQYFTDIFYFKKSVVSSEFFKMLDPVLQNWRSVYVNLIKENKPEYFNLNLCINIAIKLLGLELYNNDMFKYTFISLENVDLDDNDLPEDWTRYLSCWVKDRKVKINNHQLNDLVFYNSSTFIDEEVLDDFGTSS